MKSAYLEVPSGSPNMPRPMDRRATFFGPKQQLGVPAERRATRVGGRKQSMAADTTRRQSFLADRHRRMSLAVKNRARILHEVRVPNSFNGLYSVRFSPGGATLATSFGAGAIQVRDPVTGDLKGTLRSAMDQASPVMCLRYHPQRTDQFFAASACGTVFLCNAVDGDFSRFLEEPNNEINTLDFNLSGEVMATAGKDATIRVYDVDTAKMISMYSKMTAEVSDANLNKFHRMRIFALRFHPQSRDVIVSGGWDDTLKIWDVRMSGGCIRMANGPHICGDAIDIKEKVLLTGSWVVSGSLQTWDFNSCKLIDTIMPYNRPTTLDGEFLYTVQYFDGDPYGEMVSVGGSGTGTVEVISLKEKKVMGSFRVNKAIQALDSCGSSLCFGGMETVLRLGEFC